MPTLTLTLLSGNGPVNNWSDVSTPLNQVKTLLNTTKLDYLNMQDNGLRTVNLRSHANLEVGRVKVRNATGGSLAVDALAYASGTYSDGTDNYPKVAKAVATGTATTNHFAVGIIDAVIADGADGTMVLAKEVSGLNTSGASVVGDSIYLSPTAGAWTTVRPTGNQFVQVVGYVSVVHASTGRIVFDLSMRQEEWLFGAAGGLGAWLDADRDSGIHATAANTLALRIAGSDELVLDATSLSPNTNDGLALGTTILGFADFHLATGGVINWANGEITITETDANTLTIAGTATRLDLAAGILELNNAAEWDTGVAVVAGEYSIGRDADATNQLHFNVPTGATFEWSVNDAAELTLSATILNLAGVDAVFNDSQQILLGTGSDSALDYDGTNTVWNLRAAGTGNLLLNNGLVIIGDGTTTTHAGMTLGLYVDQRANDNGAFGIGSSDVAHGLTSGTGYTFLTGQYLHIQKNSATSGGAGFVGIKENVAEEQVMNFEAYGGQANATQTTAAVGLINFFAAQHDGANALAAATNSGVMYSFRGRNAAPANVALFIIDEDGDFLYDGADGGAFDLWVDAPLLRRFALETADPATVARSKWDELVKYDRTDLIRADILSYCSPEDAAAGHRSLVNGAQLQRALVGEAWQGYVRDLELAEKVEGLEAQVQKLLAQGRN